jgi:hypothetical protein
MVANKPSRVPLVYPCGDPLATGTAKEIAAGFFGCACRCRFL